MTWSAAQYVKFEDERNRPIHDLLARLPAGGVQTAADVGCGPGNSTQLLREKYPGAAIVGIDSSADMIAAARRRLPGVAFEIADLTAWSHPGPFDLILANASLQWAPDHETLLPALLAKLAPGGRLAVQTPDNFAEPTHRLMVEVASDGPWAATLACVAPARPPRPSPDWYYRFLRPRTAALDLWRTTYFHTLSGPDAIVEWVKGTGLRPFIDPLDADLRAGFLTRYGAAIAAAYPALPDGSVVLPFPRLFYIAARGD